MNPATMKQYRYDDVDALQGLVSETFGNWSAPVEVSQKLINDFAELTGDNYWIHTDPEKCKTQSPFGSTIAHGFLTLVLLPKMRVQPDWEVVGYNNIVNYGSNKLRFSGAVPSGAKIHARGRVKSVEKTPKGQVIMTQEMQVNVVGQDRPAVVYELMMMYM
jgi:acyl dehydratase